MPPQKTGQDRRSARAVVEAAVTRRSVLKTGVFASGTFVLGGASGSAAARRPGSRVFKAGTQAFDVEDPEPDVAIVLAELDIPIDDWLVYGNETVADQNPAYDPETPVVVVAFEHHLESGWSDWRRSRPQALFDGVVERGIKFYAFPKSRLERQPRRRTGGFNPRAFVIDREVPAPETAVVLATPGAAIDDWLVYGDETVADHNPAYNPADPVVIVAFEHLLDDGWPDWRRTNPNALFDGVVDRGIKFHAFPQSRLDRSRGNGATRGSPGRTTGGKPSRGGKSR